MWGFFASSNDHLPKGRNGSEYNLDLYASGKTLKIKIKDKALEPYNRKNVMKNKHEIFLFTKKL
jgi:hypothetical protein